jgi:hypothetical protein
MKQYLCVTTILLLFSFNIAQSETASSIPQLINYQGMLTNAEGHPLETKEYKLSFSIFNQPTGDEAVWGPQIFDGKYADGRGAKVPVIRGHFNVILGEKDISGRIITDAFQSKDAYLEITIENSSPILPRQQILSTPFALNSKHAVKADLALKSVEADHASKSDIAEKLITSYAQLESPNHEFAANSWTDIKWEVATITRGISVNGSNITFSSPGIYRITLSFRPNIGGDVWSGVRLFGNYTSRGHSAGFGQINSFDPGLHTVCFLTEIDVISTKYQIQIGRLESGLSLAEPLPISGEQLPALQATIEKVGEIN